jgi:radical SAM protein with 4Fe4S-binding SPASM domain
MTVERPHVSSVAIELTTRCNLRCAHCYNADHGAVVDAAPAKVVARIARLCDAVTLEHATLTGGEPLLFTMLFEVLNLLRERGVRCQIISNGTRIDGSLARRLTKAGVRGVQLSLHGPTAEEHEAYTGVRGSFQQALDGVRALHDAGTGVTGCVVVTRRNATRVGDTLALWKSLGISRVALSRFSPSGLAGEQVAALLPSLPEVIAAFDQALPYTREGMQLFCTMPIPPCALEARDYAPIRFGSCAIGTTKQEFALGPDGALRHCTLHHEPIGGVVDILDPSVDLAALFGSSDVAEYKSRVPAFCEGCLHAGSCGGGCGAASIAVFGKRAAVPDPLVWQHVDDAFGARLARKRGEDG